MASSFDIKLSTSINNIYFKRSADNLIIIQANSANTIDDYFKGEPPSLSIINSDIQQEAFEKADIDNFVSNALMQVRVLVEGSLIPLVPGFENNNIIQVTIPISQKDIQGIPGENAISFSSFNTTHSVLSVSLHTEKVYVDHAHITIKNFHNIIGSRFNDHLEGHDGDNAIFGLGGQDMLSGNKGNDLFLMYSKLPASTCGTIVDGGEDYDTIDFSLNPKGVTVNLLSETQEIEECGTENIVSIIDVEAIVGSPFNDTFIGDDHNNVIDGGIGGNDTLTGGQGRDTFVFHGDYSQDTVTDFEVKEDGDVIDLSSMLNNTDKALAASYIKIINVISNNGLKTDYYYASTDTLLLKASCSNSSDIYMLVSTTPFSDKMDQEIVLSQYPQVIKLLDVSYSEDLLSTLLANQQLLTHKPSILLQSNKYDYIKCNLMSNKDAVVKFNYDVPATDQWQLNIKSTSSGAFVTTMLPQSQGVIPINLIELPKGAGLMREGYTYSLKSVGQGSSSSGIKNFYVNDCATISNKCAPQQNHSKVSAAGDMNDDKFDDIIVSGMRGDIESDIVYIIYGGDKFPAIYDICNTSSFSAGLYVFPDILKIATIKRAGDINKDNFSDIVIGASDRAHIIYGSAAPLPNFDMKELDGKNGFHIIYPTATTVNVSPLGDVNGDKFDDIAMSTQNKTYVIYGSDKFESNIFLYNSVLGIDTLDGKNGFMITYPMMQKSIAIGAAGDVNGDQLRDIIISTQEKAYIIYGSLASPSSVNINDIIGNSGFSISLSKSNSLISVGGAGDVNGDALDDIILNTIDRSKTGVVYVIYGKKSNGDISIEAMTNSDGFCISYSLDTDKTTVLSGNINGDEFDDIIINTKAKSYIVYGKASNTNLNASTMKAEDGFVITYPANAGEVMVSLAGDTTGSNSSNLIIGTNRAAIIIPGLQQDNDCLQNDMANDGYCAFA